ncbi:hypothetical protein Emed_007354 [Eimeria media]
MPVSVGGPPTAGSPQKQGRGAPTGGPQGRAPSSRPSPAERAWEDYKSEEAVALHEVRTLPPGREVYVQLGGVFLLADANTAERRLLHQQQQRQQQQQQQES